MPRDQPDICPSVGWLKDFADPETLLGPVFNGKNILDVGNSNFSQLDNPDTNKLMDDAEVINDPAERNTAGEVEVHHRAGAQHPVAVGHAADADLQERGRRGEPANAAFDLTATSIK